MTLSGGEQQRLAIACAIAMRPSILVMDEPTANLDPAGAIAVLEIARRLCREDGLTVIVAGHDVEALAAVADRLVVLEAGAVVADGVPREVIGRLAAPDAPAPRRPAPGGRHARGGPARRERRAAPGHGRRRRRVAGGGRLSDARRPVGRRRTLDPGDPRRLVPVRARRPAGDRRLLAGGVGRARCWGSPGPTGSGKSTLARLMNGLLRPASGTVEVDGLDTARNPVRRLAAHAAYVAQHPNHQLFASTGPRRARVRAAEPGPRRPTRSRPAWPRRRIGSASATSSASTPTTWAGRSGSW